MRSVRLLPTLPRTRSRVLTPSCRPSRPLPSREQLVIDKDLQNLPRRPSDGAFIVRAKATEANPSAPTRVFKLNSVDGGKVFIKRGDGDDSGSGSSQLEPRYVHLCPRCATPTAYQATPLPATRASIVYLHYGGFTEQQGTVPAEAWEGEDAVVDEP